jgi:hypothetical protein
LVEHLTRNEKVVSSILTGGSTKIRAIAGMWQRSPGSSGSEIDGFAHICISGAQIEGARNRV